MFCYVINSTQCHIQFETMWIYSNIRFCTKSSTGFLFIVVNIFLRTFLLLDLGSIILWHQYIFIFIQKNLGFFFHLIFVCNWSLLIVYEMWYWYKLVQKKYMFTSTSIPYYVDFGVCVFVVGSTWGLKHRAPGILRIFLDFSLGLRPGMAWVRQSGSQAVSQQKLTLTLT